VSHNEASVVRKPGHASPFEKTLSFLCDSRLNFYENPQNFHIFRASFVGMIWNYHMYSRKFFTKWQKILELEKKLCFSRVPKSSVISWKLSRIVFWVFVKIKSNREEKIRFSRKVWHDQASVQMSFWALYHAALMWELGSKINNTLTLSVLSKIK